MAMAKLKSKCPELFHPNQLGVALPKGAEIGAHALRQFINHKHTEDKLVLKIDFKNAFNSIRRDVVLTKVQEHVPELYNMVWQAYSSKSFLYFGDSNIINSMEGGPTRRSHGTIPFLPGSKGPHEEL